MIASRFRLRRKPRARKRLLQHLQGDKVTQYTDQFGDVWTINLIAGLAWREFDGITVLCERKQNSREIERDAACRYAEMDGRPETVNACMEVYDYMVYHQWLRG